MSTLDRALSLLSPGEVLNRFAAHVGQPAPQLQGSAKEGTLCDFRPGLEEANASLSYKAGRRGPVFRRFGGDDFEGGALAFLTSAGIPKPEAVGLLIQWAGLEDEKPAGGKKKKPRRGAQKPAGGTAKKEAADLPQPRPAKRIDPLEDLRKLEAFGPLAPSDLSFRLRGLRLLSEGDGSEAAQEVSKRGLWPAVLTGRLRVYGLEDGAACPRHSFAGALFFEVRGPDGAVWAVKLRNTDAALNGEEKKTGKRPTRYAYTGKGAGRPAWCASSFDPARPSLIVEGELNAAACAVMLEAAGQGDAYNVQGVASAGALPHVSHLSEGSKVYVFADMGDKRGEGEAARERWARLCAHMGAQVFQLGKTADGEDANPFAYFDGESLDTRADACEALGFVPHFSTPQAQAQTCGEKLLKGLEDAALWQPAPEVEDLPEVRPTPEAKGQPEDLPEEEDAGTVWLSKREGFGVRRGRLCALRLRSGDDGDTVEEEELLNFAAFITAEVTEEDGSGEAVKVFEIEGTRADGAPMNPARLRVPSGEFMGMGWPAAKWGAGAIVRSGNGKKDRAREAIQRLSEARGVEARTVYQFTGWQDTEDGPVYLTAGAKIGARGAVEGLEVDLTARGNDSRMDFYALPDPAKAEAEDLREAVRASLDLLDLVGLDGVSVPVMGAVYRAPLGRADFAVFLTGETGRNKTAFLALAQAHYGAGWNAKRLPAGWHSSANGLEKSSFAVKDALFLIDDFKPDTTGSPAEASKMHAAANRIFTTAADGAGRSTLTADRRSRAGLYPRGLVMTSGESLPRGHSNRARMVIADVTRKLIPDGDAAKSDAFYAAADRAASGVYALALARYIQGLAGNLEALRVDSSTHSAHVRQWARVFEGAHGRTGHALAELSYGWACFLAFAVSVEAITEAHAVRLWGRVVEALADTADGQAEHLHTEDPITRALRLTASLLAQGRIFLADLKTGEAPEVKAAPMCGWQVRPTYGDGEGKDSADFYTRPGAVMVGYYSKTAGDEWAHFLPDALHEQLQRAAQGQAGAALPDAGTLWANMRDRLNPKGLMRCQVEGKRVRAFWKTSTPDGLRPMLLTLRLPLDNPAYRIAGTVGTVGTVGTDGEEKTYDTGFLPVPITLFFNNEVVTVGTEEAAPASLSPSPSDLPDFQPEAAGIGADLPADTGADSGEALEEWGEV